MKSGTGWITPRQFHETDGVQDWRLVAGGYVRDDKPFDPAYEHPGTTRRLAVLTEVSRELGVSPNQVVLAWLMGGDPPVRPIVGATSVAELDESLGALELNLDPAIRARLDSVW